jgi:hypothetical protein
MGWTGLNWIRRFYKEQTMTVQDLIKCLQQCDSDKIVVVDDQTSEAFGKLVAVREPRELPVVMLDVEGF